LSFSNRWFETYKKAAMKAAMKAPKAAAAPKAMKEAAVKAPKATKVMKATKGMKAPNPYMLFVKANRAAVAAELGKTITDKKALFGAIGKKVTAMYKAQKK